MNYQTATSRPKFKMFQTKINHGSRVFHILGKPTSRHHHLFQGFNRKIIAQNHSSTKFQHFKGSFATFAPSPPKEAPKKKSPAPVDTSHVCASSQSYKPVAFPAPKKNTTLPHQGFSTKISTAQLVIFLGAKFGIPRKTSS